MFAVPGAYDRAITVFSPDGRLFQVEYASETVKRGATVLGIASPEGVVLAAEERAGSKLQDLSFMWKIFQIDDHVGTAVAGLSCDAHILVDQARIYAQSNKLMYDEPIDIEILTRRIGEIKQLYTQHAGVRPFGISMLFGGVDKKGSRLFWTDPSGAFFAYRAWAIGAGGDAANEILEAEYRDNLTMDEALLLGMKCMTKVLEGKAEPQKIRVAVIPRETGKFQKNFGTTDAVKVAEEIMKSGELQLTTEQRRQLIDEKRRQIITIISRNAIDPRSGAPHPPLRIEQALEQIRISIDPYKSAEEQAKQVIEDLRPVLPIKMEQMRIAVKVFPEHAARAYNAFKSFGTVTREEWQPDGALVAVIEMPAGMYGSFTDRVSKMTQGTIQMRVLN